MKAKDIMTRDVVKVAPQASVHEAAAMLARHGISGLPVAAADGRLLGLVSEGDLSERVEVGAEPQGKWWLEGLSHSEALAERFAKAHGQKVSDVMTRHVATVHPDADLAEVAGILHAHHVKRVPVVQDGKLIGIVTRSDIVKALAGTMGAMGKSPRSDGDLQRAILERMRQERWLDTSYVNLVVSDGKVTVSGLIGSTEDRRALGALVEEISGTGSVKDQLEVGLPLVTEF